MVGEVDLKKLSKFCLNIINNHYNYIYNIKLSNNFYDKIYDDKKFILFRNNIIDSKKVLKKNTPLEKKEMINFLKEKYSYFDNNEEKKKILDYLVCYFKVYNTEENPSLEQRVLLEYGIKILDKQAYNMSNLQFYSLIQNNNLQHIDFESNPINKKLQQLIGLNILSTMVTKNDIEFKDTYFKDVIFPNLVLEKVDGIVDNPKRISNDQVMHNLRNSLAHNQYKIFTEDKELYIRFSNGNYFTGIITFSDIAPYIEKLPIDYSKMDNISSNILDLWNIIHGKRKNDNDYEIAGISLMLNLIFNNNKEHYFDKYLKDNYENIFSSDFNSKIFGNGTSKLYDEYYANIEKINVLSYESSKINSNVFDLIEVKYKKEKFMNAFKKFYNAELVSAKDVNSNFSIPNEFFLDKIRNAVAHGNYNYDSKKDEFIFIDKEVKNKKDSGLQKGDINFVSSISKEKLKKFLCNEIFMKGLCLPNTRPDILFDYFNEYTKSKVV